MLFCQIEAIVVGTDVEAIAAGSKLPPDTNISIDSSQAEITNVLQ